MKKIKIPEHRPISLPKTIDEKVENLLHPQDLKRLNALRESYWKACQIESKLEPLTEAECEHMLGFCCAGFSLDESLAEIGLTRRIWNELCATYGSMKKLSEACDQLLKSHCDRLLELSIRDTKVNLQSVKIKLSECRLADSSVIDVSEFTKLTVDKQGAYIMNCLASGVISVKMSHQLLDVLSRVNELVSVPALEKQVQNLQDQLD